MYETHYLQRTAYALCGCYSTPFMQGHRTLPLTPHTPTHLATGFLTKYFALGSLKKKNPTKQVKDLLLYGGMGGNGEEQGLCPQSNTIYPVLSLHFPIYCWT